MTHSKLIVAGPGTGKTTRLVEEIATLIASDSENRSGIIVCTFTRKAAEELRTRLLQKVTLNSIGNRPLLIGTIHSVCLELLKLEKSGKYADFEVISEDELPSYINAKLAKFGFNRELYKGGGKLWQLCNDIIGIFTLITDQRLPFETYDYSNHPEIESIVANYSLYRRIMSHEGKFDFASVQDELLRNLREDVEFRNLITLRFGHVYVDEYQDTNNLQNEIFLELCRSSISLNVVGDDDQSIYNFRGANVHNLIRFPENMQTLSRKTDVEYLKAHYRSTPNILNFNSLFIKKAVGSRFQKDLRPMRRIHGNNPIVKTFETPKDEADWITSQVQNLTSNHAVTSLSEIAILLRSAKFQSDSIRQSLTASKIPFKTIGVGDMFSVQFMREFLCTWDFILNRDEDALESFHQELMASYPEVAKLYFDSDMILKLIAIKDELASYGSCIGLLYDLFQATQFLERNAEFGHNLGSLTQLVLNYDENVKAFDPYWLRSYFRFLEKQRSIDYDDTSERDAVNILTIHRAKGLEFEAVFMPYQVTLSGHNGVIDSFRSIAHLDDDVADEEKRLFYVGATRAVNFLAITRPENTVNRTKRYIASESFEIAKTLELDIKHEGDFLAAEEAPVLSVSQQKRTGEITQLSYSQINTYKLCPRQYLYRHVWRLETVRSGGMQFGANIHRILQNINKQVLEGNIDTIEVGETVERLWKDNWFQDKSTNASFRRAAERQVSAWVDFLRNSPQTYTIDGIEESFQVPLGKTLISGRFDLIMKIGNRKAIIDFKTGERANYDSQLSFYALCFELKYGYTPVDLYVYYLNNSRLDEVFPLKKEVFLGEIETTVTNIENKQFDATPGIQCHDCAYNKLCTFAKLS